MILHSARVGISSHWHRNFIVPTMCHISCKESKNRHPVFVPCLFLLASNHFPSQVSNNWSLYRFLLLPCSPTCRKGESTLHWQKENALKHISPIMANAISPSPFLTYRADMKFATAISKAVSHQRKYRTSDNQEQRGKRVMCSRDLWTIFHFLL